MRRVLISVALMVTAGTGFLLGKLSAFPRSISSSDLPAEKRAKIIGHLAYPDYSPVDVKTQDLSGFKVYYIDAPNARRLILDSTNYRSVMTSDLALVEFSDNSMIGVGDIDMDGKFEHLEHNLPARPHDEPVILVDKNRDGIYDLKSVGDTLYYYFLGNWHEAVTQDRTSGIVVGNQWQPISWNGYEFGVGVPNGIASPTTDSVK